MKDMRWKRGNCFRSGYEYRGDGMTKKVFDRKQIVVKLPAEDTFDLLPSREVTQEVLDLLDDGEAK